MAVDWTDPCARAAALRTAYFALIAGDREQRIRVSISGAEREVVYAAAKLELLASELRRAEAECSASTGGTAGRRYAIRGGAVR